MKEEKRFLLVCNASANSSLTLVKFSIFICKFSVTVATTLVNYLSLSMSIFVSDTNKLASLRSFEIRRSLGERVCFNWCCGLRLSRYSSRNIQTTLGWNVNFFDQWLLYFGGTKLIHNLCGYIRKTLTIRVLMASSIISRTDIESILFL